MKILASGLDHQLDNGLYEEWEDTFGFGPCGAYAAYRRECSWGDVAICTAVDPIVGTEFSHYIIVDDGVIDLTNPFDNELTYQDIEVLDTDEMPDLVGEKELRWMREKLTEHFSAA